VLRASQLTSEEVEAQEPDTIWKDTTNSSMLILH